MPWMQASQNTAQAFLGVNFKCNACHDSFVSKWKLKDAYGLAAYPLRRAEAARSSGATSRVTSSPSRRSSIPSFAVPSRHRLSTPVAQPPRRSSPTRATVACRGPWSIASGRSWWPRSCRTRTKWTASREAELLDWLANDFVAHSPTSTSDSDHHQLRVPTRCRPWRGRRKRPPATMRSVDLRSAASPPSSSTMQSAQVPRRVERAKQRSDGKWRRRRQGTSRRLRLSDQRRVSSRVTTTRLN